MLYISASLPPFALQARTAWLQVDTSIRINLHAQLPFALWTILVEQRAIEQTLRYQVLVIHFKYVFKCGD